jgi:hypothetical protein
MNPGFTTPDEKVPKYSSLQASHRFFIAVRNRTGAATHTQWRWKFFEELYQIIRSERNESNEW